MSVNAADMKKIMEDSMKNLAKDLQSIIGSQSQFARQMIYHTAAVKDATTSLEEWEAQQKKEKRTNEEALKVESKLRRAKEQELALLQQLERDQKAITKINADFAASIIDATQQAERLHEANQLHSSTLRDLTATRANVATHTASLARFGSSLFGVGKMFNLLASGISIVIGMIVGANKVFMEATTKSAGVIEKTTGTFDGSMGSWMTTLTWATGVETARALEIMASNRQVVNSLGGMDNAIALTKDSVNSMRGFYGSLEESLKENMGILTQFGQKGVKPTNQTILAYNTDLKQLAKQTGLAATSINALINSVSNDTDSLYLLKQARIGERAAILANQRALLQSNIALGMTAEQAAEAGKMLNKMVAQKPIERMKQAAKMRVLGAAMGMGPEANRAADIFIKGSRATPAELKELNNLNVKMTGMMDTAAQGGLAQEIFATTLLEKLNLDQYYGSSSPFSATLGNQLKMSQEAVAAMYQSSTESVVVKLNVQIEKLQAIVAAVMEGSLIGGAILQAVQALATPLQMIGDVDVTDFSKGGWWRSPLWGKGSKNEERANAAPKSKEDLQNKIDQDTLTAEYRRKAKEDSDRLATLQKETAKAAGIEKENYEKQIAFIKNKQSDDLYNYESKLEELKAANKTRENEAKPKTIEPTPVAEARPAPGEHTTVKIAPDPVEQAAEKAQTGRVEGYASDQVTLITAQNSKIDDQLKQMGFSNDFLKTISENTSTLIDLADKQLAVATMNEKQKSQFAATFGNENSRFNADYAIGAAVS